MRLLLQSPWHRLALLLLLVLGVVVETGCTPVIGDSCTLSTDCASDGTRICDTSEPGGYCTVLNCTGNNLGSVCPDNAICVLFNPNVPGCPFSARSPSRISESQCRNTCSTNSDCRTDYICALPSAPPWSAEILDPDQSAMVCLPQLVFLDGGISPVNYGYDGSLSPDAIPPVCQAAGPTFDAGFPPIDSGIDAAPAVDAALDAKGVGKADATLDAGHKDAAVHEAGSDARKDAPSGSHDGGHDTGHDSGHETGHDSGHEAGHDSGHEAAAPKDGASDSPG